MTQVHKAKLPTKNVVLQRLARELPHLRQKYGVVRLALFGSVAKDTARHKSDIDLLVELDKPLGLEFVSLADELEKRLDRKVDVATFDCLKRNFANPRHRSAAQDIERTLIDVQ